MKTIKEYKKILDRSGDAPLLLINEQGESYIGGNAHRVTRIGDVLKLKWAITPESHAYPYTHAVLHQDNEIYVIKEITPVRLDPKLSSLELSFNMNGW